MKYIYIATKSAGKRYTISLLVSYNAILDFRSFRYTVEVVKLIFTEGHISVMFALKGPVHQL